MDSLENIYIFIFLWESSKDLEKTFFQKPDFTNKQWIGVGVLCACPNFKINALILDSYCKKDLGIFIWLVIGDHLKKISCSVAKRKKKPTVFEWI